MPCPLTRLLLQLYIFTSIHNSCVTLSPPLSALSPQHTHSALLFFSFSLIYFFLVLTPPFCPDY
ncbi:hypothetical protein BC940DRAFT_292721 [Gongronella butleri]|nr:hypothetical protein BC940DRAFT_292721 [Gongronella butleri]